MPSPTRIFAVIMAGGSGTRFWPLSRQSRPKQFLSLSTARPLIVETLHRLKGLAKPKDSYVVCGQVHAPAVKKLLKAMPPKNVLVEPQARNTAPAIALAVAAVGSVDPQGVVVVLPSDQHVANVKEFDAALRVAAEAAQAGQIVTLGIKPTRPETGYGYIKVGRQTGGAVHDVAAFVEKPTLATALDYLASGEYVWNAGIFVFRADVMRAAFEQQMPELFASLTTIEAAWGTPRLKKVLPKAFAKMPATSIDYGVAEKVSNISVVPVDCGWSDVGSFNALSEVRRLDAAGNVIEGSASMVIDSTGCVVLGRDRPVAVVGMRDVVVVDAGDAVLVLPKDKSQDVRKVVEQLKAKKALQRYL